MKTWGFGEIERSTLGHIEWCLLEVDASKCKVDAYMTSVLTKTYFRKKLMRGATRHFVDASVIGAANASVAEMCHAAYCGYPTYRDVERIS